MTEKSGVVCAVKLYPAGATTNSQYGVTDLFGKCLPVLEELVEQKMPLLVNFMWTWCSTWITIMFLELVSNELQPWWLFCLGLNWWYAGILKFKMWDFFCDLKSRHGMLAYPRNKPENMCVVHYQKLVVTHNRDKATHQLICKFCTQCMVTVCNTNMCLYTFYTHFYQLL